MFTRLFSKRCKHLKFNSLVAKIKTQKVKHKNYKAILFLNTALIVNNKQKAFT
jgi:hypothetical protein